MYFIFFIVFVALLVFGVDHRNVNSRFSVSFFNLDAVKSRKKLSLFTTSKLYIFDFKKYIMKVYTILSAIQSTLNHFFAKFNFVKMISINCLTLGPFKMILYLYLPNIL
jgi:hypothetical protein